MWEESKHPRDSDGKFTNKGNEQDSIREFASFGKKKKLNFVRPLESYDRSYQHKKGYIAGAPKGKPMTHEEADSGRVNPKYNISVGYKNNCAICVATYIARRLGYDVEALPYNEKTMRGYAEDPLMFYEGEGNNVIVFEKVPKGTKTLDFLKQRCQYNKILVLSFEWNKDSKKERTGHVIVAEKTNNGICLYDPQNNRTYMGKKISQYLFAVKSLRVADLTNVRINEKIADKSMRAVKK